MNDTFLRCYLWLLVMQLEPVDPKRFFGLTFPLEEHKSSLLSSERWRNTSNRVEIPSSLFENSGAPSKLKDVFVLFVFTSMTNLFVYSRFIFFIYIRLVFSIFSHTLKKWKLIWFSVHLIFLQLFVYFARSRYYVFVRMLTYFIVLHILWFRVF